MHHFSFPTMYCICLYVCVCISVCISVAFQLGKGDEEVGSNASLFPLQQCMPAGSPTYHFTWTLIMPPGPPPAHSAHKYIAEYEDKRNTEIKDNVHFTWTLIIPLDHPLPLVHADTSLSTNTGRTQNTHYAPPVTPPIHNLQVKKNTNPKIKTKIT